MIQFFYNGDAGVSMEDRERSKNAFLEKLGPFKDEFDEKNGSVTINFNLAPEDENYFQFTLGGPHSLSDFIMRFNQYIRTLQ